MSPRAWTATLILAGLLTHGAAEYGEPVGASQDELERGFSAPPNEAKPWNQMVGPQIGQPRVVGMALDQSLLHAGRNEILVHAANAGDGPHPAGLVGGLLITLDNGGRVERKTEPASWTSSADGERWTDASLIGPLGCAPWGPLVDASAAKASLAWIHRRCRGADVYFLANSLPRPVEVTLRLRSTGQAVRLFDPFVPRAVSEMATTAVRASAVPLLAVAPAGTLLQDRRRLDSVLT